MLTRLHRAFVVAGFAVAVVAAVRAPPRPYGDASEYLLMAESLASHASPELREADVAAVTRGFLGWGVEFPPHGQLVGYYPTRDGRRYSYHFWAYSLATVPVRLVGGLFGLDPLKAPQLTNALLMGGVLLVVLLAAPLPPGRRLALGALLYFSPALWFVLWPHPEVFSFAFVSFALIAALRGRTRSSVLLAAVGALQNPQLGLLVAWLAARGAVRGRLRIRGAALLGRFRLRAADALTHLAPALVLLAYPAFFYWNFGTFSIVANEATSLQKVSLGRALGLLFDLNVGLLPYVPIALLAWIVALGVAAARRQAGFELGLAAVMAAILLANTLQWNYNHGTSGPSRYVVWLTPLVFVSLARLADGRVWSGVLAAAVAVQVAVVWSRGGLVPRYDYLEHSPVAAFVLDRFPSLYDPDYEVFIKRTLHREGPGSHGPYVYAVDGRCRKVLANRTHEQAVRERCGELRPEHLAFFRAPVPDGRGGRDWTYLDF